MMEVTDPHRLSAGLNVLGFALCSGLASEAARADRSGRILRCVPASDGGEVDFGSDIERGADFVVDGDTGLDS